MTELEALQSKLAIFNDHISQAKDGKAKRLAIQRAEVIKKQIKRLEKRESK